MIIILILLAAVLCGGGIWLFIRARRRRPQSIDLMEGHDFEYFCAELLKKHGFLEVEVTRGSGDYGIDILAEKEGVTYAIQCKCYTSPVGVKAVQEHTRAATTMTGWWAPSLPTNTLHPPPWKRRKN